MFSPPCDAVSISPGETAPIFTLSSIEGKYISLDDYSGYVVVLIYWRPDHKRSLLALKDASDVLKEFKEKDVRVITVIAGKNSKERAKEIIGENKIEYPVLIDSERKLYSSYGIRVYPTTIIIDKNGKFAYGIPSHPLTFRKVLKGYVKKALGEIDESQLQESLVSQREGKDKAELEALRLYNLAMNFTRTRMIDMAISTVLKSIEANPNMAKSYVLLGFLYLEEKDADRALEAFKKAIELTPDSHDAKTGIGGALVLKGDIDKAIEILNEAIVANPYPQMTYYELGKAYELKDEKDKSIEMYKKAIEKIIDRNILPSSVSRCQ
jgi:peroxiredoxin